MKVMMRLIIVTLASLMLVSCTMDDVRRNYPDSSGDLPIVRLIDKELGIVCYRFRGYAGISCVEIGEVCK